MPEFVGADEEKNESKYDNFLLDELERLVKIRKNNYLDIDEETEISRRINDAVNKYRAATEYDLMKYKLTSDALGIALWDMDVISTDPVNPNNRFMWSQEFRHMLGFYDENDFPNILSSWSDRLHPEDKEMALNAFAAHINDCTGKTPFDIEYRLMLKNGSYRYFYAFGTTLRNSAGVPLRVAGALQDINNQKLLEANIAEQHAKTKAMAYWYESILDATPFPITVTDANMNWTFVNKAVEKFLEKKREDMIGMPCSNWNSEICNTDACGIVCAKRGVNQTCFFHKGSSYQVDIEILRDMKGEITGFIEVVQDITKVETMARQQADAENEAKSLFLANMSHEMRTPMNAIIGMTAIGKKAVSLEEKNMAFKKIEDASSHLLGVINDVLDMTKIEANKLELAPIEFNFEKMLQKIITIINFRIEEKQQILSVNIDKNIPPFIVADDQRLAQVITNLLSNAVKFTPEGGEIHLEASLTKEKNGICELRIEVADSGIGISLEQQKKLFIAFGQAESGTSRQYGGTGLGLVISKRIVELMDGIIWLESELGKGARFIFTVKIQRGKKNDDSPNGSSGTTICKSEDTLNTDGAFEGKKVLIAEDIEINREIFIALLENTGLIIDCAQNGKEALDMIAADPGKYDLVFMDLQMPQMDGLEAARCIRSLPAHQRERLPIVAMTANVFKEDIEACLAAGMDDHLGKPLDIEKVLEKLRKYLKR